MTTWMWTALVAAALLWPARTIGPLDGIPLTGRLEAIVIGVVVPALWYLDREFLRRRSVRAVVIALLVAKAAGTMLLTQQGFCARFSLPAPFRGISNSVPIDEPTGALRSWDARADWGAETPRCTAILDRSYGSIAEFPAWFLNLVDAIQSNRRDLTLDVTGYVSAPRQSTLALDIGSGMVLGGRIGDTAVESPAGGPIAAPVSKGAHALQLRAALRSDAWRFVPSWQDGDAWSWRRVTIAAPSRWDEMTALPFALLTTGLAILLIGAWAVSAARLVQPTMAIASWAIAASAVMAVLAATHRFERLAGSLLLASVFVPVHLRHRNARGAFVIVGIPWLTFFVSESWPHIGHITAYSYDDWLVFQSAAYRIFLNGYWLEGGSRTFYFQPFYRWIAGSLHALFGDSSVGEIYWDSVCLLMGALLCFSLVKPIAGFRVALAAAAATLAVFTLGTVWYFVGRGLSEIAAAGWAFLAAHCLLRSRLGRVRSACAAGVFAALMFYTRLNHAIFAGTLAALLIPVRAPARWRDLRKWLGHVNVAAALAYIAVFACGVVLFAVRTWWYTGVFSVLYGTSATVNETGLRFDTLGSLAVWHRVVHSLAALVWMNEPPRPDPRSLVVAVGALLAVLALLQIPGISRLPFSLAAVIAGTGISPLFAHAHHYPGRMSIHLVPFAVAMSFIAGTFALAPSGRSGAVPPVGDGSAT